MKEMKGVVYDWPDGSRAATSPERRARFREPNRFSNTKRKYLLIWARANNLPSWAASEQIWDTADLSALGWSSIQIKEGQSWALSQIKPHSGSPIVTIGSSTAPEPKPPSTRTRESREETRTYPHDRLRYRYAQMHPEISEYEISIRVGDMRARFDARTSEGVIIEFESYRSGKRGKPDMGYEALGQLCAYRAIAHAAGLTVGGLKAVFDAEPSLIIRAAFAAEHVEIEVFPEGETAEMKEGR